MEFKESGVESVVIDPHFWRGKKILLTGHTGFKGSWLSVWLKELGVDLIGFSKSIPTKPSLFEAVSVENGITSIMSDIRDFDHLKHVIREHDPEIIIHMAAQSLVLKSYEDPVETYSTNVMGTVNVLEAVRQEGTNTRVIVNVTSDKCYENMGSSRRYNESDPMGGHDPYSSSKGCSEIVTSSFRKSFFNGKKPAENGTTLASVRAGNVIGGGDWAQDRIIPDMVRAIEEKQVLRVRRPHAIRPWQHVLEPLYGYLLLIERMWSDPLQYAEGWNFGPNTERKTDLKDVSWIVEKFRQEWGDDCLKWVMDNDNNRHEEDFLLLDCTKAKMKLGWTSKMDLELALRWTVEWYRKYYQKHYDMRQVTEEQIRNFMLM